MGNCDVLVELLRYYLAVGRDPKSPFKAWSGLTVSVSAVIFLPKYNSYRGCTCIGIKKSHIRITYSPVLGE